MSVFGDYARYYDLLYRDKDYVGEAAYIHTLIEHHDPQVRTVLELGSGTGRHAELLADRGYHMHGVERSTDMLAQAKGRAQGREEQLAFSEGDLRTARIGKTFDCVISLFHVFSYQTTNADLAAAFATARAHLKPGGLFIFDCWYGPCVLTDRPAVRVKRVMDEKIEVTRLAEPHIHANENIVDVHYHVFIRDKETDTVSETRELHRMRYLFQPEIELFLANAGFGLLDAEEWLTRKPLGFDTWGSCFVARARDSQ